MNELSSQTIWNDLQKIREQSPLVHNITNYVVMNLSANALLAIGASPVMAHAIEEVQEMVTHSQALVINVGTLSRPWLDSMQAAMKVAQEKRIPVILDPVGAGATHFRTNSVKQFLDDNLPNIIRGNVSEIFSLAGFECSTKGVDSTASLGSVVAEIRRLSHDYNCIVCISGKTDFVVHGNSTYAVSNGHPIMTRVTGMGCVATALVGAFVAVNDSPFKATAHAMALIGVVGEIAAEKSNGPGSFQTVFLDYLYKIDEPTLKARLKLEFQ